MRSIRQSTFGGARRVRPVSIAAVVVAAALMWTTAVVPAAAAPAVFTDVIIQFVPGTDARAEAASLNARGGRVAHVYENVFPGVAASLPSAAISALGRNPRVAIVEADGVATTTGTQTSPVWGLDRSDQRSLPLSGSFTWTGDGSGVSVYVVDTGVRPDHRDFGGRVVAGYTAISDEQGTNDCNGHGTHVAATAAGTTYGMAKAATVVPVRVLDCNGSGSWSGVIAGLDWIVSDHVSGPAVANMSLGGGAITAVDNAVRAVINDGVTVAVAAGNSNANACNYSPARTPEALTVGATTSSDARASYSNVGSCLDLFAPGSSVTSAWYTSTTATNRISGTSMASPHVAGAAAMLLSLNSSLTPAEVGNAIVGDATKGVVGNRGAGSPNLLLFASPEPSSPAAVPATPAAPNSLTAGDAQVTVGWVAPSDGGSTITGYLVTASPGGETCSTSGNPAPTSCVVTGLTNGTPHTFTVRATNAVGNSGTSPASAAVTPVGATAPATPAAPNSLTAGDAQVTVGWVAPSDGGSTITSYLVTASPGGRTCSTSGSPAGTSCVVTGLTNDTAYTFTVRATNAVGSSGTSAPSAPATPFAASSATAPASPTGVTAQATGKTTATVSWIRGADGGSPLTSHTVVVFRGGRQIGTVTVSGSANTVNIGGLRSRTTYTFRVSATNAVGTSALSDASNAVTTFR